MNVPVNLMEFFPKFKENLITIDEVHMVSYIGLNLDLPKGLKRFNDKYVDFGMKL